MLNRGTFAGQFGHLARAFRPIMNVTTTLGAAEESCPQEDRGASAEPCWLFRRSFRLVAVGASGGNSHPDDQRRTKREYGLHVISFLDVRTPCPERKHYGKLVLQFR